MVCCVIQPFAPSVRLAGGIFENRLDAGVFLMRDGRPSRLDKWMALLCLLCSHFHSAFFN